MCIIDIPRYIYIYNMCIIYWLTKVYILRKQTAIGGNETEETNEIRFLLRKKIGQVAKLLLLLSYNIYI